MKNNLKFYFVENELSYLKNNRFELAKKLILDKNIVLASTLVYSKEDLAIVSDENIKTINSNNITVTKNCKIYNTSKFIAQQIKIEKPDIIHIFTINSTVKVGMWLLLQSRKNIVCSITGLGFAFMSNSIHAQLIRLLCCFFFHAFTKKHNVHFIFQNQGDIDDFQSKLKIRLKNITLIKGSGVDTDIFIPFKTSNEIPNVLFAGRLLRDKGIYEFIEASTNLIKKNIKANFLIAGEIDSKNPSSLTQADLQKLCKNSSFQYIGYQSNMRILIQNADIICLPSHREGLSKFLIEGAACGKAIVTNNVPGCKEVVTNNVNGLLVEAKNVSKLSDAIEYLINNEGIRNIFGLKSREIALNEFSKEIVISKIKQVYNKIAVV